MLWRGPIRTDGYGAYIVSENGRRLVWPVHRVFYMLYRGRIPRGYLVHHTCENKRCVNPAHLQIMTPRDHIAHHGSMLKAQRLAAGRRAALTHCKRGHEFTPENTDRHATGRRCRRCEQLRKRGLLHAT